MNDSKFIKTLSTNQKTLNPNFKKDLLNDNNIISIYNQKISIMRFIIDYGLISFFEDFFVDIDIDIFNKILLQLKDVRLNQQYEKIINAYMIKHIEEIKNYQYIQSIIDLIILKPTILNKIYPFISENLSKDKKILYLNKLLTVNYNFNKESLLLILEGNNITPTMDSFNILLNNNALSSKDISDVIDIFILYGFTITKNIVIRLLNKRCKINFFEKYNIPIDEEILITCCNNNYYPYDFNCIPPYSIMTKECGKNNNFDRIKEFKEKGGIIDIECLENACFIKNNKKVIKYIINECKINANDNCFVNFEKANGTEGLEDLIISYEKKTEKKKIIKEINIDENSTMSIKPSNVIFNNDDVYTLKNKIKTFFNYKNSTIKYVELLELMMKYLINKKLIIANYFIVNEELSDLTKISQCVIINIDQLDNILGYFVS
jgi:hypothetical protein